MKASKIRRVEPHRLMQPDEKRLEVLLKPRPPDLLNPVWLRFHPGVTFPEDRGRPRTSMEAALRSIGL